MCQHQSRSSKFWDVLSWISCVLVIFLTTVVCIDFVKSGRRYEKIFLDFGEEVPEALARIDAIPDWAVLMSALCVIAVSLFLQLRIRRKFIAVALHLLIAATVVLVAVVYYGPVFMSFISLIERLSS